MQIFNFCRSRILLLALFIIPAFTQASPKAVEFFNSGIYLGVMSGYAIANYTNNTPGHTHPATLSKHSGFANQVFIGYDFSKHWGVRLAALYFTRHPTYQLNHSHDSLKIKNTVVSFMPTFTFNFNRRLALQLRAGIGYVVRNGVTSGGIRLLPSDEFITPTVGAGLNYALTSHWHTTLGWLHSFKRQHVKLPGTDFFGAGVIYHF